MESTGPLVRQDSSADCRLEQKNQDLCGKYDASRLPYNGPVNWPATIAVNKKYMLVAQNLAVVLFLFLLIVVACLQVQSEFLELYEFPAGGRSLAPTKITPSGPPN